MKKLFVIPLSYLALALVSSFGSCSNNSNNDCQEQPADPSILCTADYNPVCGCNDVTYSNSCNAEAVGITDYTPGECPSSQNCVEQPLDPAVLCSSEYEPVCGCNDVTYTNSCYANGHGITDFTAGACPTSQECVEQPANPAMTCITLYDPVCGCNGVTYSNSCMAEVVGITSYTQGECVTYFP